MTYMTREYIAEVKEINNNNFGEIKTVEMMNDLEKAMNKTLELINFLKQRGMSIDNDED